MKIEFLSRFMIENIGLLLQIITPSNMRLSHISSRLI